MKKNKIPKLKFIYSRIYDAHWLEYYKLKSSVENFPTSEEIIQRKTQAVKYWNKHGNEILARISKLAGLDWKENLISVYLVGKTIPFSHPLTIGRTTRVGSESFEDWIDTLVHELLHVLLVQNEWSEMKNLENLLVKFKDEPRKTYIHIPIHALHKLIYLDYFHNENLMRDLRFCKKYLPDYSRAWEIVDEIGAENIVKSFN